MNLIIEIIIYIVIILILSFFFGWIIGKWRFKHFIKKLDKQINDPKEMQRIAKLKIEQDEADERREVNQNDRWNRYKESELRRRKQGIEKEINQLHDENGDVGRSRVQDTTSKQDIQPERRYKEDNRGDNEIEWDI